MTVATRRSFLSLAAGALGAAGLAGEALAQVYREDRPVRRRQRRQREPEGDIEYCQPMCAEDTSPCDSPTQKAVDGRCSSPTAGSFR